MKAELYTGNAPNCETLPDEPVKVYWWMQGPRNPFGRLCYSYLSYVKDDEVHFTHCGFNPVHKCFWTEQQALDYRDNHKANKEVK